jgi:hypothetical protein
MPAQHGQQHSPAQHGGASGKFRFHKEGVDHEKFSRGWSGWHGGGWKTQAPAAMSDLESRVVEAAGDSKVYVIRNGRKHWIANPQTFTSMGFDWNAIVSVDPDFLARFPEGKAYNAAGDIDADTEGPAPIDPSLGAAGDASPFSDALAQIPPLVAPVAKAVGDATAPAVTPIVAAAQPAINQAAQKGGAEAGKTAADEAKSWGIGTKVAAGAAGVAALGTLAWAFGRGKKGKRR